MRILMTGATGLVGKALSKKLIENGHELVVLTRSLKSFRQRFSLPCEPFAWDYKSEDVPRDALNDVDAVIHLAGATVAQRWNDKVKNEIMESRRIGTTKLVEAVNKVSNSPKVFLSASGIAAYGNRNDDEIDETSGENFDHDFLAEVTKEWESASQSLNSDIRRVILRIGLVLSGEGGALSELENVIRTGAGGPVGNGRQWMSWIHIEDLISQILFLLENGKCEGTYNGTSPNPVRNKEFTRTLATYLRKPAFLPAPKFGMQIVLGEFAQVLFDGQKVLPKRSIESGFKFQFESLDRAMADLYQYQGADRLFVAHQWIPNPVEEVFGFFSDEKNLEKMTPDNLNFKVLGKSTEKIEENTLIDYQLRLHGIPFKWQTRIESWQPNQKFSDTQLSGPYHTWYHTHSFESLGGGTWMTDQVRYKLPLGWLGDLFGAWHVKKEVQNIFKYRTEVMSEIFPS